MSGGDFLSRWSRRKRAVEAAEAPPAPAAKVLEEVPEEVSETPPAAEGALPPAEPGALTPEEIAALPRVEDLTGEMDLTAFLRAGVPSVLRNAALRRMWSLDPTIRDYLSEAREYAYDWNVPGGVPGNGPLEPGTDVKAMVRAIFGDRDPPAEPNPAEAAVAEAEGMGPEALPDGVSKAEDGAPASVRLSAAAPLEAGCAAEPAGDDPDSDEPHAGTGTTEAVAVSGILPAPEPAARPQPAELVTKRAVRRHGSAIPI